jgi:hypothetical protein
LTNTTAWSFFLLGAGFNLVASVINIAVALAQRKTNKIVNEVVAQLQQMRHIDGAIKLFSVPKHGD